MSTHEYPPDALLIFDAFLKRLAIKKKKFSRLKINTNPDKIKDDNDNNNNNNVCTNATAKNFFDSFLSFSFSNPILTPSIEKHQQQQQQQNDRKTEKNSNECLFACSVVCLFVRSIKNREREPICT